MLFLWALLTSIALSDASLPAKRYYDTHTYYALEHLPKETVGASLAAVAEALGVEVVEQVGELGDVWLVRIPKPVDDLSGRSEEDMDDPVIAAFQNLQSKAYLEIVNSRSEDEILNARKLVSSVNFLERQVPMELVKRAPPPVHRPTVTSAEVAQRYGLKDPLFSEQWHLVNDEYPEHMMNTTPVWDMGFTGKGILTSFLDDGLDFESDDLKDAFDAKNSYDFIAHVPLPRPTGIRDHHGTRCAGQVAARRNNACGVGIAYDAMAAGVRILGGPLTSVDEAAALNYGYKDIGVYSCSWGPRDNGQTMDSPSYIVRKAVLNGVNNGRDGKGSIFVFASGNGGRSDDQCNFDGYTNSIYSVTVSSVDYKGLHPSYSESCAANMIVAYSSGSGNHIVTTDRGKSECTKHHGGTSASAPNVVGVIALALQARPELTWRDVQHLCIETARMINPDDSDWEKTATGRLYSYKYGYGALDAYAYVKAAQTWKLVKPQAWIHTKTIILNNAKFHDMGHKKYKYEGGVPIDVDGYTGTMVITKEMMKENNLDALEHIDIRVWINHSKRGDVEVQLISPNGIKSMLASTREYDEATTGFPGWRFNTIKHWGENPVGEWKLKIDDQSDANHNGTVLGWNLAFWGSAIDPSKAVKFIEPVNENALPPSDTPSRPVPNDPELTATTVHARPTDQLPTDHGQASGENSRPSFPGATGRPKPQEDTASEGWVDHMTSLVGSQKWFFAALGAASGFAIGALVYFWRRRVARQRLAQYTALAEDQDNIHMNAIGQGGAPRTTRALYDAFGQPDSPSVEHLPAVVPRSAALNPPTGVKGLGFHSGFLDDDEPSAGLSPRYFDEPDDNVPRSGKTHSLDEDGSGRSRSKLP